MVTKRERAAARIGQATRWDHVWCLRAADHLIDLGKYDVAKEDACYDSIQWLLLLTDAQLLGNEALPEWFANEPVSWTERLGSLTPGQLTLQEPMPDWFLAEPELWYGRLLVLLNKVH